MSQVKIQVIGADGKYRGSLFKDGPWHDLRWAGTPKPNLHESMVCTHEPADGTWYLLEYVVPRQIVGEESRDSLFDEASTCRQMTPVQALHWFTLQPFGPPPELASHVLRITRDWPKFCASSHLHGLVDTLGKSLETGESDPTLHDIPQADVDLLVRLRLIYASGSAPTIRYSVDHVAQDMGVADYITWMSAHISRIATWLDANAPTPPLPEGNRHSGLANGSWVDPTEKQDAAHGDGAILARVAKDLCAEVDQIHSLRRGQTTSGPWENELASQMPSDIVGLRRALNNARSAISDLGFEKHSLKSGRLSTDFLARFGGDHAAAKATLPKLIEEAHEDHKQAAAALDARTHDQACAQNSLIEGWLATHREKLQAMRDEFAQPYERQLDELTLLHDDLVAVDPWQETSYCGVLLKIVDATLRLLDCERSMDNYMETARLSKSFTHLTATEWEDLEMRIRSETAKIRTTSSEAKPIPANHPSDTRPINANEDTPSTTGQANVRGQVSRDRDFEAVKLAQQWDKEERAWTQQELAQALDVDRTQLFGKARGAQRCPLISAYWKKKQDEKNDRKDSLRASNRTRTATDELDDV